MMIASSQIDRIASDAKPQAYRCVWGVFLSFLTIAALASFNLENGAWAADAPIEDRVQALIPDVEAYMASGMKGFDVPGLAIGIVASDRLVYAKGFGVRSKSSGLPVDTKTIFQIASTTKAFLAATQAIMVDRGKLRWDDRVVDLDPEFQLKDPWVTREFRVFDLLAQRSGLPPLVNDMLAYDRPGTPVGEKPSRSEPVRQPTTAEDAVADLHALLSAADEAGPYVLVGHSYGGLIVRLYASVS